MFGITLNYMGSFNLNSRLIFCTLLVLSVSVLADTAPPEAAVSDLEVIEQDKYGEFLAAGNVDWSSYSKVQLEKGTVAFRKNWVRDQRRHSDIVIRERDEERIKSDMSDLLHKILTGELTGKGGYEMTDQSGADAMRFTPRIVDLDIIAPDRVRDNIGFALADSKLSMTLELEIYDSVSGELLAKSWQYQDDPYKGYMEEANSVSNRQAARLMLLRWSTWLQERLDEVGNDTPD